MSDSKDEETDNLTAFKLPNINVDDFIGPSNVKLDLYESDMKPGIPSKVNNGWSKIKEDKIKQLSEENQIYAWLLDQEARRYNKYDIMIIVPLIALSSCSAVGTFISVTMDEDALKIFNIVSGIIQGIVFALALTKQFFNPGKTSQIFSITSKKYTIMNNHFAQILSEDVNERTNGTIYLREKRKERDDLYENTPKVSDATWAKFYRELQSGNLFDINSSVLMKRAVVNKIKNNTVKNEDAISIILETDMDNKTKPSQNSDPDSDAAIVVIEDSNINKNKLTNKIEDELKKQQQKAEFSRIDKQMVFQLNRLP
jgi:hypothetical protein